ncbi:hypothetical protein AFERRI_30222 [Acidithiobacillus ferrivorans]|uniref:Uncharacterized protein n=1 Tax=Acidithiobacillus ferrivorans TaxID=160808 RepID=A0A060UMP8_9PROT|nr:hypothetical protein AFERRI_30222 [Acidithiobacillus ferrivorans]
MSEDHDPCREFVLESSRIDTISEGLKDCPTLG